MVCVISCERYSQIIAESSVHQIRLFFRLIDLKLLTTFQNLEDQFFVISTLFTAEILNMFHTWSLHGGKPESFVSVFDHLDYVIPDLHLLREHVLHTGNRFLL